MPLPRSHAEILGAHRDALLNEMRKCIPATVTAVNASAQTVDVQVAVSNVVFDEFGNGYEEPAPSITNVPLGFARGGGFMVWVPVAVGDSVLLVFSDLSTDRWRAGDGTPQPPGFAGKHTLDSPFAIPCCAPDKKALHDPGTDEVIIGQDSGQAQIRISASDIELGVGATAAVALCTLIDSFINVVTATYTPAGPETGFAAFITALSTWKLANWPLAATTGATLVKAK